MKHCFPLSNREINTQLNITGNNDTLCITLTLIAYNISIFPLLQLCALVMKICVRTSARVLVKTAAHAQRVVSEAIVVPMVKTTVTSHCKSYWESKYMSSSDYVAESGRTETRHSQITTALRFKTCLAITFTDDFILH